MNERERSPATTQTSKRGEGLLVPLLVAAVGGLISLSVWTILVLDRHERVTADTQTVASSVREVIDGALASQQAALRSLARVWWWSAEAGPETEAEVEAQATAEGLAGEVARVFRFHPGIEKIAVFDRQTREALFVASRSQDATRSTPHAEAAVELRALWREARSATYESALLTANLETTDAASRGAAYWIHVPIDPGGAASADLLARFDPAAFLHDFFRARSEAYAIEVHHDGVPIYQRGEASSDPWQRWWKITSAIPISEETRWQLVYRPTAAYASARLNSIPHYALFLGISLSACLAFLTHELRRTRRQSRSLGFANASLEERERQLLRLNEELENRVVQRTRDLEDAVVELRAFNYSVSHDLRSPLGAILNFASLLKEDYQGQPLDAEGLRWIDRIMGSARRATLLLEDLLELSRAGRAELRLETVDMERLVGLAYQQAAAVEQAAEEQELTDVELKVDPLPIVQGDPQLLETVFVNLFSNALKYSRGQEKRRIHVSGTEESGEAIFTVSDNGRGFDMRFAPKLFEVFERLHHDDEVEGTGVGLAIVARILKRHEGRVWARGQVGEGARFSFALPVQRRTVE